MADSPSESPPHAQDETSGNPPTHVTPPAISSLEETPPLEIEIEIVSDDEMALLETALTAAAGPCISLATGTLLSSPLFRSNARSISTISALPKRRFSRRSEPEIEDFGPDAASGCKGYNGVARSLLDRFRRKKALSVTDFTGAEWCEMQMKFILHFRRRTTKAMKAGSARHEKLEQEVVKRVKVRVKSTEDKWATRFLNFITGANQLMFEGLTRELPIICFAEGVWMVGVIDEVRMPTSERNPILVDTKTRVREMLPAEPQQRNGRFQLMCYKFMWDNLVGKDFSSKQFFDYFHLDRLRTLSEDIRENACNAGLPAENLDEILRYYKNTCSILPPAHNELLLRYELQRDHSVLGEDWFEYDSDWVEGQMRTCLEFWLGKRDASYTPEQERWKCRFCQFGSVCPVRADSDKTPASTDSHRDCTEA